MYIWRRKKLGGNGGNSVLMNVASRVPQGNVLNPLMIIVYNVDMFSTSDKEMECYSFHYSLGIVESLTIVEFSRCTFEGTL